MNETRNGRIERIERKASVFHVLLLNAYKDPEDQTPVTLLPVGVNIDFAEDLTGMLLAMRAILDDVTSEYEVMNLIEFTHLLNNLAIQGLLEKGRAKK